MGTATEQTSPSLYTSSVPAYTAEPLEFLQRFNLLAETFEVNHDFYENPGAGWSQSRSRPSRAWDRFHSLRDCDSHDLAEALYADLDNTQFGMG